jgi:hypothetical protein
MAKVTHNKTLTPAIDSGTSQHTGGSLTDQYNSYSLYRQCSIPIETANGDYMYATSVGDVLLTSNSAPLILKNVLTVPESQDLLLSVSQFAKQGNFTFFNDKHSYVFDGRNFMLVNNFISKLVRQNSPVITGNIETDGLYRCKLPAIDPTVAAQIKVNHHHHFPFIIISNIRSFKTS